jgi:hypothetical protein
VRSQDVSVLMKPRKRVRDIFLEIVIAVALVIWGIIYVASHPRGTLNWGRIAMAGNTLVVFGFLISWFSSGMETTCVLDNIGRPAAGPHCNIYFGSQLCSRLPFSLLRCFQLHGDGSVHRHFEKTTHGLTLRG